VVTDKIDLIAWAKTVPAENIPAALAQLAAVQCTLAARLMSHRSDTAAASTDVAKTMESEPLINAREMARRLDVHESWIRTEQRAGRIPFVQVGRYIRFRPSEVLCALERSGRAPGRR
jgi:excisionase family DNA binding protein